MAVSTQTAGGRGFPGHRPRRAGGLRRAMRVACAASTAVSFALVPLNPAHVRADEIGSGGDNSASSAVLTEAGVLDPLVAPPFEQALPPDVYIASNQNGEPAMLVDPVHRLGFVSGQPASSFNHRYDSPATQFASSNGPGPYLLAFNLDTLNVVGQTTGEQALQGANGSGADLLSGYWAVDSADNKLIGVSNFLYNLNSTGACVAGAPQGLGVSALAFTIVDYSNLQNISVPNPIPLPCIGLQNYIPEYLSLDEADGKLYVVGTYGTDAWRGTIGTGFGDNTEQPMVVVQLDLATLLSDHPGGAVDWQIDLREAGCGAWAPNPGTIQAGSGQRFPFVQRVGSDLLSYCTANQPFSDSSLPTLGYVVRIPLHKNAPVPSCGPVALDGSACQAAPDPANPATNSVLNFSYASMPALNGPVFPSVDPVSGQMLLDTADQANGDAVWVFDPDAGKERFVGVFTGGQQDQPPGKTAAGLDPVNGRAYLLTSDGVLMVQDRLVPLSSGEIDDVVNRPLDLVSARHTNGEIQVLPGDADHPTRLFIPIQGVGYRVVDDQIPSGQPAPPIACTDSAGNQWSDPDCKTDPSLTETAGQTASTAIGAAQASGARVLVAGGVTHAVDNNDPACQVPGESHQYAGSFDPHPPGFCFADQALAAGDSDLYFAATDLSASSDFGSNADASGLTFPAGDSADPKNLDTFQQKNPYSSVSCTDEGNSPSGNSSPTGAGSPESLTSLSETNCDASTVTAKASSAVSAMAVPSPSAPVVTVAQASSTITTGDTTEGQETVVQAVASGITIGGQVSIGQVVAQATTQAHGHAGTTKTTYKRWWCAITIGVTPAAPNCIDPDDPANGPLIDEINQTLGSTWITAPAAEQQASPGGYQSVADKDPGEAQADAAVNADTSPQVPGMQIIHYNDGPSGLSRVIVQLANIDSESRYSVYAVPDFGSLDDNLLPEPALSQVLPPTPSLSPVATPQPQQSQVQSPPPQTTSPAPRVRSRYVPATTVVRTIRPAAAVAPLPLTNPGTSPAFAPETAPPPSSGILAAPQQAISRALHLLVENPAQFALLAGIWTLLLAPAFVAYRRRSWARALES